MITIKGTEKIKGALNLAGIQRELKAGDTLPITDEEFKDHTVQIAVDMGYISYKTGEALSGNSGSVQLRNIYDRAIRINALDGEVRPGQTFTLPEDLVHSSDIRGALAKGMLEIVSSARGHESDESSVKVGNIFAEEEAPTIEADVSTDISQEPETSAHLETNEEVVNPSVIETEDPSPIRKNDIPDPKRASVVWNPNKDPIAHTRSKMESVGAGEKEDEGNVDVSDISFVDAEMDEKRKASHPVLKEKPEEATNDGIDFL